MRKILICCILTGYCIVCGRSVSPTGQPAVPAVTEQSAAAEEERIETDGALQFEPAVVELDEIPLGERRTARITATNRTTKPLVILDVYTSCHCTKVAWDKKPVASGATTTLEVHYTAEETGIFFKKIVVRHSAAPTPATFAIQGAVMPRE